MDREKVIKGLEYCKHTDGVECPNCPYCHEDDCIEILHTDILALLKEQEHKDRMFHALEDDWKRLKELLKEQKAVEPQDAEMLIVHNGGAKEYVKDIESIVLLAHKDYDIVYCGVFSEGR